MASASIVYNAQMFKGSCRTISGAFAKAARELYECLDAPVQALRANELSSEHSHQHPQSWSVERTPEVDCTTPFDPMSMNFNLDDLFSNDRRTFRIELLMRMCVLRSGQPDKTLVDLIGNHFHHECLMLAILNEAIQLNVAKSLLPNNSANTILTCSPSTTTPVADAVLTERRDVAVTDRIFAFYTNMAKSNQSLDDAHVVLQCKYTSNRPARVDENRVKKAMTRAPGMSHYVLVTNSETSALQGHDKCEVFSGKHFYLLLDRGNVLKRRGLEIQKRLLEYVNMDRFKPVEMEERDTAIAPPTQESEGVDIDKENGVVSVKVKLTPSQMSSIIQGMNASELDARTQKWREDLYASIVDTYIPSRQNKRRAS
jgi:hypothetical protein